MVEIVCIIVLFTAVCRTRDSGELAKCDIVVDVGGVYNPQNHRYDHHQR